MKAIKYILASALCMLVSTACSGSRKSEVDANEPATNETSSKQTVKKDG